ncbi:hypothetical protein ECSTECMHI813_2993 [Escherichia coli STEC_MHI813]|nr:hypothetical protein ECSTECMHI813_2993 [Escherichia coli STEC_MHI813]
MVLPVYPRWRGEHRSQYRLDNNISGLSPLARGTQRAIGWRPRYCRFIPAGAGNTTRWRGSARAQPVYPRWRGEHTKHTYLFLNNFISHQQSTN